MRAPGLRQEVKTRKANPQPFARCVIWELWPRENAHSNPGLESGRAQETRRMREPRSCWGTCHVQGRSSWSWEACRWAGNHSYTMRRLWSLGLPSLSSLRTHTRVQARRVKAFVSTGRVLSRAPKQWNGPVMLQRASRRKHWGVGREFWILPHFQAYTIFTMCSRPMVLSLPKRPSNF